jgi:hypothetical protein
MNRAKMGSEVDGSKARRKGSLYCMGQQKAKYRLVSGPWNECQQIILQPALSWTAWVFSCYPEDALKR